MRREVVCLETGDSWLFDDRLTPYQTMMAFIESSENNYDCASSRPKINRTKSNWTLWIEFRGNTYAILNDTRGDSIFQDMPEGVNFRFCVNWETGGIDVNIPVFFSDIDAKRFTRLMRICRKYAPESERKRVIHCLESELKEREMILTLPTNDINGWNVREQCAKRLIEWEGFPMYDFRYQGEKVISYEWYSPVHACERQIKKLRKSVEKLKKESWGQPHSRKKPKTH